MENYFIGYVGMALALYRSLKCLTKFIPTQGLFISTMCPQDLKRVLHPCPHFELTLLFSAIEVDVRTV